MMNSVPAPRFSIIFYKHYFVGEGENRQEIKGIQLPEEVAKLLQVHENTVFDVLRAWGLADYPQEYEVNLDETGIDSRGKAITYRLSVWNYQGGELHSKGPPYKFGILKKQRSWGNGFTDETTSVYFYLGALA